MIEWSDLSYTEKQRIIRGNTESYLDTTNFSYDLKSRIKKGWNDKKRKQRETHE